MLWKGTWTSLPGEAAKPGEAEEVLAMLAKNAWSRSYLEKTLGSKHMLLLGSMFWLANAGRNH